MHLLIHSICFLLAVTKACVFFAAAVCVLRAPSSSVVYCGWKHISSCTLHSNSYHMQKPAHVSLMAINHSQNDSHWKLCCFGDQCALTGAVWWRTTPRAVFPTVPCDIANQRPSVQTRVLDHWAVSPAAASWYCCVRGYARITAGNGCRQQSGKGKGVNFIRSSCRYHSVRVELHCHILLILRWFGNVII